jgi:acyl-CoA dehydrogenase
MFITNGPIADVAVVYAKTDPEAGAKGITAFIVEKDFPGFSAGKTLKKMGGRGSPTGELIFEDCEVPAENVLLEENKGVRVLMSGLDRERIVYSISPIGTAQGAFDAALKYAMERKQFGAPIASFQMIQQMLADMSCKVEAARQLVYHSGWLMEQGHDAVKEISMVKAVVGELVNRVTYDCVQFHGGMGYLTESPIERMYRDARIHSIGGGATEVMLEEIAKRM